MKISKSYSALTLALLVGPVLAQAAPLINEPFTYANGDLTTVSGGLWTAHSSGGTSPIQVLNNAAVVQSATEDVGRLTGQTLAAGGTLYGSFDVSVSGGNNQTYFAHFMTDTAGSFTTRVFVTSSTGSDFTFGLRTESSSSPVKWGAGLSFNTIYKVAFSYSFDTGLSRLWVNPVNEASTSISDAGTAGVALGAIALRQGGGNGTQTVDNFKAGTTFGDVVAVPEPSTVVMLGVGVAGVLFAARRRRVG